MQKAIAILLALILLLGVPSAVAPVGAGEPTPKVVPDVKAADGSRRATISQEKALAVLQAAFPEIISGKDLEAEYSEHGQDDNPCWGFKLKGDAEGPVYNGSEIMANVNAETGEIISMNYNPAPDYYRGKSVTLARGQAYSIAKEFLQKIQPDKVADLILQEDNQRNYYPQDRLATYYSFYWNRQVNGIKVDWDNIFIGVDAITGKVTHYSCIWHNAEFPKVSPSLSPSELTVQLIEEIGLYPSYISKPVTRESAVLIPIYSLNSDCRLFDAQTGQALKEDGTRIAEKDKRIFATIPNPQTSSSKIEIPVQPTQKISPELAKKTAEEFFKKMGIAGEIRRSGGGSSSGFGYTQEFWHYSLVEDRSSRRFGNGPEISIDVHTGEIHQFHNYAAQNSSGETGISYAEALKKAQEAIEKLNPEKKSQLVLRNRLWDEEPVDVYTFYFNRLVNGISCQSGIKVEINKQTGSLVSYWVDWHPFGFESLNNIISPQKAQTIFKKNHPFELAYIFPTDNQGEYRILGAPLLVYRYAEGNQIDARSGEMLSWGNARLSAAPKVIFMGHPADPALSLLQESGLLPEGAKPEAAVTRRQAMRIIMAAIQPNYYSNDQDISLAFSDIQANDPDRTVLQKAVRRGIISNQGKFKPDQNISREEMAVWLVNALSYQDIARMKNSIAVPFKDAGQITKDKLNFVGLADGLGMLAADTDQSFRPQDDVSWAEIAMASTKLAAISSNRGRY